MIKWRCDSCGTVNESDEFVRHSMDMCSCGESGVDADKEYIRTIGNLTFLIDEEIDRHP